MYFRFGYHKLGPLLAKKTSHGEFYWDFSCVPEGYRLVEKVGVMYIYCSGCSFPTTNSDPGPTSENLKQYRIGAPSYEEFWICHWWWLLFIFLNLPQMEYSVCGCNSQSVLQVRQPIVNCVTVLKCIQNSFTGRESKQEIAMEKAKGQVLSLAQQLFRS